MSKKTLLLNASYEVLAFIPERKAFKLLCKEVGEILLIGGLIRFIILLFLD